MPENNDKQRQGNKDAQSPMRDDRQQQRDIEEAERRAREGGTTMPGRDQHGPGDRDHGANRNR